MQLKNISRIDQPDNNTHGWFVRIRRDGKALSKFFSDRKHGGKDIALEKATTYRDSHLDEWVSHTKSHDRSMYVSNRSNVGYHGISYTVKNKKKNGKIYLEHMFTVTYTPEKGVNKNKSFYIRKGKTEAEFKNNYEFKLNEAIKFRDDMMRSIFGFRYVNHKIKVASAKKEKVTTR